MTARIVAGCSHDGCARRAVSKGLCGAHYKRLWRGSPNAGPVAVFRKSDATRGEPCRKGCGRPSVSLGLCWAHYARERRYNGDPDAILAQQGGVCALCGAASPGSANGWATDHDHATGRVRGVLCHGCNVGLGAFRDSIDKLQRAIRYLRRTGHGQTELSAKAVRS